MHRNWPKTVDELDGEEIFAILEPKSTHIEGDERSRTNPGHGYPAHTVHSWDIITFKNRADWETDIRQRMKAATNGYKNAFRAVVIVPAKITSNIDITIY